MYAAVFKGLLFFLSHCSFSNRAYLHGTGRWKCEREGLHANTMVTVLQNSVRSGSAHLLLMGDISRFISCSPAGSVERPKHKYWLMLVNVPEGRDQICWAFINSNGTLLPI